MVNLVENANARHDIGTDFFQYFVGYFKLTLKAGIAGINDVEQQRGIQRFVEG